jgi:hypothetical protein
MFLDELMPLFNELTGYPVAFLGGFFSGLLQLNLGDDPVKSWLDNQAGSVSYSASTTASPNGKGSTPQSITIE